MAYHVDDAFKVLKDVHVPETHNTKVFRFKDSGPLAVARQSVRRVVLPSIELDESRDL